MCISFLKYYICFLLLLLLFSLIYGNWYMIYDILYIYMCVYTPHHMISYSIMPYHTKSYHIISFHIVSYYIILYHTNIYIYISHVRYIIYTIHYTIYNRYLKVTVLHTNKGPQYYAGLGAGNDRWKSCPRWKRHPRLMPEAKPFFLAV